jgi:pyruvate dehydrogenase E1 component alpha subunit
MRLIRRFEEESARAYAQGKIGGFLHLYIGQEAVAVGAARALEKDDYVLATYRDHGHALARGLDPGRAMAELFGRDTGCSRGLGGSMHFFDIEHGFLGGHGIVGGHVALAAGAAFKCVYRKEPRVVVCYIGDGAVNIGGFHEGLSLAGLWKLPLVVIVENNEYAMGTPLERTLPVADITLKAQGYAAYKDRFRGDDVLEVQKRVGLAVEYARARKGPALLEVLTYRYRGHSMSDPGKYRTKEEVEERKQRDPLRICQEHLLKQGTSEKDIEALDAAVEERVAEAVRFAEESPPASRDVMNRTVYASGLGVEQHA